MLGLLLKRVQNEHSLAEPDRVNSAKRVTPMIGYDLKDSSSEPLQRLR